MNDALSSADEFGTQHMGRLLRFANEKPISKPLIYAALQIALISALFSYYNVEFPIRPALSWIRLQLYKIPYVKGFVEMVHQYISPYPYVQTANGIKSKHNPGKITTSHQSKMNTNQEKTSVFTSEQLALFDGTRPSKPVYLAILGRVFNVDKGRKHYGQGGGYHFFAGKDASRSFVTGDFTEGGLVADVSDLSEDELMGIADWITFYERDYQFVGLLAGPYYDSKGKPTELLKEVNRKIEKAKAWKQRRIRESEVFPPCNSEWKKEVGGRVWCSSKSGGVVRDWVGVPRKLFSPNTKDNRCVCVKNFGSPLATPGGQMNRGDLDNPNLREYPDCPPTANSCKIPAA